MRQLYFALILLITSLRRLGRVGEERGGEGGGEEGEERRRGEQRKWEGEPRRRTWGLMVQPGAEIISQLVSSSLGSQGETM